MDAGAGRTFLVTGANTGIGRATAAGLAAGGGRVWITARSAAKGEAAVAGIKAATGNESVFLLPLDLADLDSVRACASSFLALGEPLHGLVNNAGVAGRRGLTRQGFELTFGVNHLGHFALTGALLGLLADSAPSRVVTVSSDAHYSAPGIDFEALRQALRPHRDARVRGLETGQRAVHAGTGPPGGGHRGHHLRAAPGRGGVGHLAAGAVAGAPAHHPAPADGRPGRRHVAVLRVVAGGGAGERAVLRQVRGTRTQRGRDPGAGRRGVGAQRVLDLCSLR